MAVLRAVYICALLNVSVRIMLNREQQVWMIKVFPSRILGCVVCMSTLFSVMKSVELQSLSLLLTLVI